MALDRGTLLVPQEVVMTEDDAKEPFEMKTIKKTLDFVNFALSPFGLRARRTEDELLAVKRKICLSIFTTKSQLLDIF